MKRVAFIFAIFYLFILISSVSAEVCLDADKGDLGERGRTAVLDDQGYEKSFNLDYCTDSNNQTVQGIFSEKPIVFVENNIDFHLLNLQVHSLF